ncbi:MAG TPA: glycine oxidase ThiO [Methylomirabilota bacterium]|nr:glycine oxidase ThiO [Methylomirabilota bacterium]
MTAPDVVVVGAGAIGAACAWELAGAGLRVTLIDRGEPGSEASGASAGLLSAFTPARAGAIGRLYRLSRDLYGSLAETLRAESGVDIEHEPGGHLELCMTEEEAHDARRQAADPTHAAEKVAFLDAAELRGLEPGVTREARGALHLPRNEWVNNGRLVTALVRAGARRGVTCLFGDPVEELVCASGRVTGVRTRDHGRLEAAVVVLAAGAWSSEIRGVPAELRVRPVKGQMIALGNVPPVLRHVLLREEVYLVPRASGECLVGATVEDGPHDKHVTAAGLRWLATEALATVPALAGAPLRRAWAGLRPASADGFPVIGPWPGLPGLVVATGHYRSGILLTPVTARIVRDWVGGGRCELSGDGFLPDRLLRSRFPA